MAESKLREQTMDFAVSIIQTDTLEFAEINTCLIFHFPCIFIISVLYLFCAVPNIFSGGLHETIHCRRIDRATYADTVLAAHSMHDTESTPKRRR